MYLFSKEGIWIWEIIEVLILAVSLSFVGFQLKASRNNNLLSSLELLGDKWNSETMKISRYQVCKNYRSKVNRIGRREEAILSFLCDLWIVCKTHTIDKEIIWGKYSFEIEFYWHILKNCIQTVRNDYNDDTYYTEIDQLYIMSIEISDRKGGNTAYTEERISKLVQQEIEEYEEQHG